MLRSQKPVALSAITGLLLAVSFPTVDLAPAAFIALVPLFFAVDGRTPKQAFVGGWFSGLIYFSGTLSWVTISMHNYGGVPWAMSYLLMFLLTAYLAIYIGVFTLFITSPPVKKNILLAAPVCWTALEYLRGHLLTGFPWNALGYSQYQNRPLIQIADIASVYGVSFLIVLVNTALVQMIKTARDEKRIGWRPLGAGLLPLAAAFLYGFYRLAQPMDNGKTLAVAVVQGNVDQAVKWTPQMRDATFEKYNRLSSSFNEPPQLVVWPESATPFFFQSEPVYQRKVFERVQKERASLLFGSPAFKQNRSGSLSLFNSAYLVTPMETTSQQPSSGSFQQQPASPQPPDGVYPSRPSPPSPLLGLPVHRYDKIHLVPFGEYVPLQSLLFFVNKMVTGIGDFVPGEEAAVFPVAGASVGTVICYEVIFPELVRRFAQNGANLMVTITNDAWFGNSAAPFQHFSTVVFRAIENRVPFARAANTGVSGFIDAHGKILQATPIFVDDARMETMRLGTRKTLYTRYGDFFALGCLLIFVLYIVGLAEKYVFRDFLKKGGGAV